MLRGSCLCGASMFDCTFKTDNQRSVRSRTVHALPPA